MLSTRPEGAAAPCALPTGEKTCNAAFKNCYSTPSPALRKHHCDANARKTQMRRSKTSSAPRPGYAQPPVRLTPAYFSSAAWSSSADLVDAIFQISTPNTAFATTSATEYPICSSAVATFARNTTREIETPFDKCNFHDSHTL